MSTNANALKKGTILNRVYKIEEVLGSGGFGITYKAKDIKLNRYVVIKEYFPANFAYRDSDGVTVVPRYKGLKKHFDRGLKSFLKEAKTLAQFSHKNIIKIETYFEENNTAYFTMPYKDGEDLEKYMEKKGTPLSEDEIMHIIIPILNGLREVHKKDVVHKDIKPENIFLVKDDMPILIDFGAAKSKFTNELKDAPNVISQGYAPLEQYAKDKKEIKSTTDIYAFGMTIAKMMLGSKSKLPTIQDRLIEVKQNKQDPLKLPKNRYSKRLIETVKKMTEIKEKDRLQSVDEVINSLTKKRRGDSKKIIFLIIALLVLIGSTFYAYLFYKEYNLESYIQQCKNNKASSCLKVGRLFENREEFNNSISFYKRACDKGKVVGCFRMNKVIERCLYENLNSNGCENIEKTLKDIGKSCKEGEVKNSCSKIKDNIKELKERCNSKSTKECKVIQEIEKLFSQNSDNHKEKKVFSKGFLTVANTFDNTLKNGCEKDRDEAKCADLAEAYEEGIGFKKDKKKALKYYQKACELGSRIGCKKAKELSIYNESIYKLIQECNESGKLESCSNIAEAYENGIGVNKNINKAKEYYMKACKLGDKYSCRKVKD